MAHKTTTKCTMIFMLSFFLKSHILIQCQQQVPCLFVFGDSYSDNGNNNMLSTLAKANYEPYGIDFSDGPTGRFTNGKNIPDFLADLLGFDNPAPPFEAARNYFDILKGVNYASGSAGILDETSNIYGDRITLNRQLGRHWTTRKLLHLTVGPAKADNHLNKCLYTVNIGTNDYINNYLLPQNQSSKLYTPDQFAEHLIQEYSKQLKTLYSYGARKVAVFGLGQLGCLPQELATYPANSSGCVDFINNYVNTFNNRLKPLVDNFNANLVGSQFIFINVTNILQGDPSTIGITVHNATCCVVTSLGLCAPNQSPCPDRDQYIFYDNVHPTQIIHRVTAARAYNAFVPSDAYPFDIHRLVKLGHNTLALARDIYKEIK